MTPYSTGRGAPGPTSYSTSTTHAGSSSYPSAGTYGNPAVDLRPQSATSNMDVGPVLGGTYRNMHPFMQDPTGMVPRPQSAMHSGHTRSGSIVSGSSSRSYHNQAGPSSRPLPHASPYAGQVSQYPASSQDIMTMQEEINLLQRRIKELEIVNEHGRLRIQDLERELAGGSAMPSLTQGPSMSTLPRTQTTPTPPSILPSWRARTDARVRLLCSLNRAGNALCAWHDSRRERRTYPPRMAPPGYLNCGCTFEEALFEESLSRHGVGSYHPGESVRMDPALRNPLFRLLQTRYGYQDGDFERDPKTGEWVEGEGNALWERKLAQGAMNVRKNRTEERR